MNKSKLHLTILLILTFASARIECGIDFSAKGEELASRIISNPAVFFIEMQHDLESTAPVITGKRVSVQSGIIPAFAPAGMLNLSAKYKLHSEGRVRQYLPQIDIAAGYWNMLWTQMAACNSDDIKEADFDGYYFGVLFAYTVDPKTRFFGGLKHSQLNADLILAEPKKILGANAVSFDSGFSDNFMMFGIEHLIKPGVWWIANINYSTKQKFLAAKISRYGKYFELGVNIYPEGIVVIHPVVNFHIDF